MAFIPWAVLVVFVVLLAAYFAWGLNKPNATNQKANNKETPDDSRNLNSKAKFCGECGVSLVGNERFCGKCGAQVSAFKI